MKYFILFLWPVLAFAHDHGGGGSPNVGPGKGVESFDEHEGFALAAVAVKRLRLELKPISAGKACDLRVGQIVSALSEKKIYLYRNGKYKSYSANCSQVRSGDQIVSRGADFLRVIEMDLGVDGDEHEEEGHHD